LIIYLYEKRAGEIMDTEADAYYGDEDTSSEELDLSFLDDNDQEDISTL
jgi:hypothetical protein